MKRELFLTLVAAGLFNFISCTSAPESDEAKTTEAKEVDKGKTGEKWNMDVSGSKIEWIGTKVTGYHVGTVPLKNGEIFVSNNEVTGGRFVMDVANMNISGPKGDTSGNAKLLGHLKSSDFFDVSKYPDATFELTEIKPYTGGPVKDTIDERQKEISEYKVTDPTHLVNGNLTMKGITKNIEFPARITVSGNTAEAIAKFNIDRKEWGIVYEGKKDDLIRDAVHLGISIKATK
jgi:polyisoprenoid-binding protein YceI